MPINLDLLQNNDDINEPFIKWVAGLGVNIGSQVLVKTAIQHNAFHKAAHLINNGAPLEQSHMRIIRLKLNKAQPKSPLFIAILSFYGAIIENNENYVFSLSSNLLSAKAFTHPKGMALLKTAIDKLSIQQRKYLIGSAVENGLPKPIFSKLLTGVTHCDQSDIGSAIKAQSQSYITFFYNNNLIPPQLRWPVLAVISPEEAMSKARTEDLRNYLHSPYTAQRTFYQAFQPDALNYLLNKLRSISLTQREWKALFCGALSEKSPQSQLILSITFPHFKDPLDTELRNIYRYFPLTPANCPWLNTKKFKPHYIDIIQGFYRFDILRIKKAIALGIPDALSHYVFTCQDGDTIAFADWPILFENFKISLMEEFTVEYLIGPDPENFYEKIRYLANYGFHFPGKDVYQALVNRQEWAHAQHFLTTTSYKPVKIRIHTVIDLDVLFTMLSTGQALLESVVYLSYLADSAHSKKFSSMLCSTVTAKYRYFSDQKYLHNLFIQICDFLRCQAIINEYDVMPEGLIAYLKGMVACCMVNKLSIQQAHHYNIKMPQGIINKYYPVLNVPFDYAINMAGFDETEYLKIFNYYRQLKRGNREADTLAALKLTILFATYEKAIDYLRDYTAGHPKASSPMHDAVSFNLPSSTGFWHRSWWIAFIEKHNYSSQALALLGFTQTIERFLFPAKSQHAISQGISPREVYTKQIKAACRWNNSKTEKLNSWTRLQRCFTNDFMLFVQHSYHNQKGKAGRYETIKEQLEKTPELNAFINFYINLRDPRKWTPKQLQRLVLQVDYGYVDDKYREFALDCVKYGLSKKHFDEVISRVNRIQKSADFIPQVNLTGEQIGLAGWRIAKVANNDPYAYILGKQTACCQSIDGATRDCVLHGTESAFGGFYRLTNKDGKVIAQCWAGVTQDGSLCFDSIERNEGYNPAKIMEMFELAAKQILLDNPQIQQVLFGGGGNSPKEHHYKPTDVISPIIEFEKGGSDSLEERYILASRETLALKSGHRARQALTLSTSDFANVPSTDSYVLSGERICKLSLNPFALALFFKQYPDAKSALEHPLNPLAEQGFYESSDKREHYGEKFIPYKTLLALANKKVIQKKHTDPRYQFDFFLSCDNDFNGLSAELEKLSLENGQNVLILAVEAIHAYAAYIEKRDDCLYIFVFDSENASADCALTTKLRAMPGRKKVSYSCAVLQKDFSSCGIFALKTLMYLAKYGRLLIGAGFFENEIITYDLMPAPLIKMSQSAAKDIARADLRLDDIVSQNKQTTLREYQKEYQAHGRNAAALLKKYGWLATLSERDLKPDVTLRRDEVKGLLPSTHGSKPVFHTR